MTAHVSTPETAAVQTNSTKRRFPLDPLRAIGGLWVLAFHCYENQQAGIIGGVATDVEISDQIAKASDFAVAMFFVISGFVIFLPLARSGLAGAPMRRGRTLLLRRCARLLPLYFFVVTVVWAVTDPVMPGDWTDLVLHLTMLDIYSDRDIFSIVGPAWSLAVEFHFYVVMALLAPVLAAGCRRLPRWGRASILWLVPVMLIASGLWWASFVGPRYQLGGSVSMWFGPLSKSAVFGLGCVLALVVAHGGVTKSIAIRLSMFVFGALIVWMSVAAMVPPKVNPRPEELYVNFLEAAFFLNFDAVAAFFVVGSIVSSAKATSPRFLRWKPLVAAGTWSYGIYLIHEPVIRALRWLDLLPDRMGGRWDWLLSAAIVAPITLALAWLSFRTIERAGLRILELFESERGGDSAQPLLPDAAPAGKIGR